MRCKRRGLECVMYKQRIGIRQSLHTTYCDIINMNMHRQDWNVNMQYRI